MSQYILSPQATADLRAIAEYSEDRNPDYADRLLEQLTTKFELVGRFPRVGRPADDLSPGLRKTPVESFVIYFRDAPSGTEIARVIHGARNVTPDDFGSS